MIRKGRFNAMIIRQVSVFLQNEAGRLVRITKVLHEADINISALSIAETSEYGVLRMIVSDTEKAAAALRAAEYSVKITDVICLIAPDVPGSLNRALNLLSAEDINVSYMYGYSSEGKARLILKTSNPTRAAEILQDFN